MKITQLETLKFKVEELEAENQKQEEKIVALRQQMDEMPSNSILSQFAIHPIGADDSNTPVAAAAMPKSCADLRYLGHSSNGLYLIPFSVISQCHFPATRVKSIFKSNF